MTWAVRNRTFPDAMTRETETRHATCVAIDGAGVLILGAPGAGKSDLALRLIDAGGALLVADDAVVLRRTEDGGITASAPARLVGLLEIRGIGILPVPCTTEAPLRMVVRLDPPTERLPEPATETLCGHALPLVRLDPFTASAPAKVRVALAAVLSGAPFLPDAFHTVGAAA